jgi:phosphoserine phosphatase RsbU/P
MQAATTQSDPHTMRCLEVWGGNQAVDNGVVMAGLDAWLFSRPYGDQSAGGDIHYVSSCAAGMVTRVLVADVSGHGEAVADAAVKLRSLMRRYVNWVDQTRFVQGLNTEFGAVAESGGFATAVVATYYAETDEFTVCNAGHPRPLWYSARSRSWSLVSEPATPASRNSTTLPAEPWKLTNVPLGIGEPTSYNQFAIKLARGDVVVLYTDSLIEAKGPDGRMLGQDGLLRTVQGLDPSDPSDFLRAMLAAIGPAEAGGGDDMTVLILRPNGLKPKVTSAVKLRAMRKLAGAALASLVPGGPVFPWPEPGPRAAVAAIFNKFRPTSPRAKNS